MHRAMLSCSHSQFSKARPIDWEGLLHQNLPQGLLHQDLPLCPHHLGLLLTRLLTQLSAQQPQQFQTRTRSVPHCIRLQGTLGSWGFGQILCLQPVLLQPQKKPLLLQKMCLQPQVKSVLL